eukprot:3399760-Pyramimonas_sp.AAC.1
MAAQSWTLCVSPSDPLPNPRALYLHFTSQLADPGSQPPWQSVLAVFCLCAPLAVQLPGSPAILARA